MDQHITPRRARELMAEAQEPMVPPEEQHVLDALAGVRANIEAAARAGERAVGVHLAGPVRKAVVQQLAADGFHVEAQDYGVFVFWGDPGTPYPNKPWRQMWAWACCWLGGS